MKMAYKTCLPLREHFVKKEGYLFEPLALETSYTINTLFKIRSSTIHGNYFWNGVILTIPGLHD